MQVVDGGALDELCAAAGDVAAGGAEQGGGNLTVCAARPPLVVECLGLAAGGVGVTACLLRGLGQAGLGFAGRQWIGLLLGLVGGAVFGLGGVAGPVGLLGLAGEEGAGFTGEGLGDAEAGLDGFGVKLVLQRGAGVAVAGDVAREGRQRRELGTVGSRSSN